MMLATGKPVLDYRGYLGLDTILTAGSMARLVEDGDTEDALSERILVAEHRLYPHALRLAASGQARLQAGRVVLEGVVKEADFLYAPTT